MKDLNGIGRNALMDEADEALQGKEAAALLEVCCPPEKLKIDFFLVLKNRFGRKKIKQDFFF